jgi:transposase-like protein
MRGLALVAFGGQIQRINDHLFLVKSQSVDRQYRVSWSPNAWHCDCPDFQERSKACKHVYAVLYLLSLPGILLANSSALERRCPYCGSDDVVNDGPRRNKSGVIQVYSCKKCGRDFSNGRGRATSGTNALFMLLAFDLFYKGVSLREIKNHIWQIYNRDKSVSTLHHWIIKLTRIMSTAIRNLRPAVGEKWLADEMVVKVRGKPMYLWNIIDYKTRCHIVSILAEGRGEKEAYGALMTAIRRVGKPPRELVTDGLASYVGAVSRAKTSGFRIRHIANVGISSKSNNNRIERRHGSMRAWMRGKRGMKERAQELMNGNLAYYNYLRPHMSLKDQPPTPNFNNNWWISMLDSASDSPN